MKDIDRLVSLYSPDIVYFDAVPPLQYVGSAVLRDRFLQWFDGYRSGIGQDVRDLNRPDGPEPPKQTFDKPTFVLKDSLRTVELIIPRLPGT